MHKKTNKLVNVTVCVLDNVMTTLSGRFRD